MASRRDQLHSYQFMVHRVISALVMRETDPAESPLRRGVGAMFAGFMIFIIVAAGFGVFGLLTHIGDRKWRVDGTVVVEKETGAVYLYQDSLLHPMANYASALLLSGHTPPVTASVSRNSLAKVRRGNELGIPNAPAALPDQGKVLSSGWTACAVPGVQAGVASASTVLTLGGPPAGARRLPDDQAVLARTPDGSASYLVYHGYRYQILRPNIVLGPLYGQNPAMVTATPAWLNTLAVGQSIGPVDVPDAGKNSAAVAGHRNGELLQAQLTSGSGVQYYLVFPDGLAPVSTLQKDIYVGQTGAQPVEISAQEGNAAPVSHRLPVAAGDAQPPANPPALARPNSAQDPVCTSSNPTGSPGVWLGGAFDSGSPGVATIQSSGSGTPLASRVVVPAGKVAVIQVAQSPAAPTGAYQLVTDLGVRYPVVSAAVLGTLGYPASSAVVVPSVFATLVPQGPTLDPAAAARPVDTSVASGP